MTDPSPLQVTDQDKAKAEQVHGIDLGKGGSQ